MSNNSEELKASNTAGSSRLFGDALEMDDRPIGLELGLAFGILLIILVGIGILGISRMDRINADLQEVLGRRWAKLQLSRKALMYSNQNSRITMQIFLLDDKQQITSLLAKRAENTQKISELVATIATQYDSPTERDLLDLVETSRGSYIASYLRALRLLIDEKQPKAARDLMVHETTPALYNYHYAWSEFMRFEMEQMELAANRSRVHYRQTRAIALLLIALAVIVAVAIAAVVTLKMDKEMRARIQVEHQVRALNSELEARVEQRTAELTRSHQELVREVAQRKSAEERYRTLVEDAVIGIFQATPDGRFINANPALARMHGYDSPQQFMSEVANAQQFFVNPMQFQQLVPTLEENALLRDVEVEGYRRDGTKRWFLCNVRAVRDSGGKVVRHDGTVLDITERKAAEQQIHLLAYYDGLTGLPNRALFRDRLNKALASARRRGEKLALLFLDLDNFKTINDSLGHSCGDLLLKELAERLKKYSREQDTVVRLGGDEFVVVLSGVTDLSSVAVAADRILKIVTAECVVQGHSLTVSCSLGISVFPDNGTDPETLLKNADAAMYSAKENRNSFRFFTPDMNAKAMERLMLESNLRLALERAEFFLVFQPQVKIASGEIIGAEALLRWRHPEWGLVPPGKFIPVAEKSGLIIPIGEWVLRTACAQARQWQEEGLPAIPVAVNVSAVQFRHQRFLEMVKKVLEETRLAPQYLELELTEGMLLSNAELTLSVLQELRRAGLRLSIDDFGTGYSSLSYLRHLPVCKLKIDRSFVQAITVNADDAAITDTIILMGRNLNLKVMAEGVENKEQMSFLMAHHCDEAQGYYFSHPLTAADFSEKVRSRLPLSSRQPDLAGQAPSDQIQTATV